MKNKTIQTIIGIILLISILPLVEARQGANFETACNDEGVCTTQVYSYEKYFQQNERWQLIDESFRECEQGICSNLPKYTIQIDNGRTIVQGSEQTTTTNPAGDFADNALYEPTIDQNTLTYRNVQPGVDIQYTLLPHMLKEDIILNEPPRLDQDQRFYTFDFQVEGEQRFAPFIACDANEHCITFTTEQTRDGMQFLVPTEFLLDEEIAYPVRIDPTIILNNDSIEWNGHIKNTTYSNGTSYYERYSAQSISIGKPFSVPVGGSTWNKGAIDWDVSSIPDDAVIYNITLELYAGKSGFGGTAFSLSVLDVENASSSYADETLECQGNCQYTNDIVKGNTYFTNTYSTHGLYNMSLNTQALQDAENTLASDVFSVGFSSPTTNAYVRSSHYKNAAHRPRIHITWGAPAFNASVAMENGINAVLSSSIKSDQQVYVVDTSGTHYLETVDKFVQEDDQAWAFNYVLPSESFLNLPSIFNVFNFWENSSLTQQEIEDQVTEFINGTII